MFINNKNKLYTNDAQLKRHTICYQQDQHMILSIQILFRTFALENHSVTIILLACTLEKLSNTPLKPNWKPSACDVAQATFPRPLGFPLVWSSVHTHSHFLKIS